MVLKLYFSCVLVQYFKTQKRITNSSNTHKRISRNPIAYPLIPTKTFHIINKQLWNPHGTITLHIKLFFGGNSFTNAYWLLHRANFNSCKADHIHSYFDSTAHALYELKTALSKCVSVEHSNGFRINYCEYALYGCMNSYLLFFKSKNKK